LAATVGARIRRARKAADLTQHQLAVLVGTGDAMKVSRWERGENLPSAAALFSLAEIFDVDVAWFYESEEAAAA
jgi:transcriptional regulator with XRE-family HTH domain